MSGFHFHIACPNGHLTSPSIPLMEDVLPFADTGECVLGAERVDFLAGSRDERAKTLTTTRRQYSNPGLGDGGDVVLRPPLRCPLCDAVIETGSWGDPPVPHHTIAALSEAVGLSRTPTVGARQFELGSLRIRTRPAHEGGRHGLDWTLAARRGEEAVDLDAAAEELVRQLRAAGSMCEDPWGGRRIRFTEWWPHREALEDGLSGPPKLNSDH